MQKETKNILWVAVGSFFSGVIITFALLCLAVAMTRPCHKGMMGPGPMPGMHEMQRPDFARHMDAQNHKRGLKRGPHGKEGMDKHHRLPEPRPVPEQTEE